MHKCFLVYDVLMLCCSFPASTTAATGANCSGDGWKPTSSATATIAACSSGTASSSGPESRARPSISNYRSRSDAVFSACAELLQPRPPDVWSAAVLWTGAASALLRRTPRTSPAPLPTSAGTLRSATRIPSAAGLPANGTSRIGPASYGTARSPGNASSFG